MVILDQLDLVETLDLTANVASLVFLENLEHQDHVDKEVEPEPPELLASLDNLV